MSKKLYVGNLSYATTEDELRTLFTEVGPVASVAVITDRMTGQSKGFAFVEMETPQAAQEAIERFNNSTVNERRLTVNEARPRESSSFGGGGRYNDRGNGGRDKLFGGNSRRRY
jgi:RNA recognition motif-containing protein